VVNREEEGERGFVSVEEEEVAMVGMGGGACN